MTAADFAILEEMCKGWEHIKPHRGGYDLDLNERVIVFDPLCHRCQAEAVIAKLRAEPAPDREALKVLAEMIVQEQERRISYRKQAFAKYGLQEPEEVSKTVVLSSTAWYEITAKARAALTHAKEARDGKA